MSFIDKQIIKFPCPQCGQEVGKLFGELRAHPNFSCSECGASITVGTDELDRLAQAADQAAEEVRRALSRTLKF